MRLTLLLICALLSLNTWAETEENPYASAYQKTGGLSPNKTSAANIELKTGGDREADKLNMLENGYDLIGFSEFESIALGDELALQQASEVGANTVLLYRETIGKPNAAMKLEKLKESLRNKSAGSTGSQVVISPKVMSYYASFWAKLPTPILGVHVIKSENEDTEKGLIILAVIKGSPADLAGLKRGDVLLKVGDTDLVKPESLGMAAQKQQGQTVEIIFGRDGAPNKTTAQLNRR